VLVFNHDAIDRGALVRCRILGVLEFEDSSSIDNKILAVPSWSPVDKYSKVEDIEEAHLKIYKHFFRICKLAHSSNTQVGEWQSSGEALTVIKESHQRWKFKRENSCRESNPQKTS
jgi:inorganic pyrophosphatase